MAHIEEYPGSEDEREPERNLKRIRDPPREILTLSQRTPGLVNTSRKGLAASRRQANAYARRAYSTGHSIHRTKVRPAAFYQTNPVIFSDEDASPFDNLHSDALVITTPIFLIPVHRILVDTGAYASVLYLKAFLKMGIDIKELRPCNDRITGFDGRTTIPEGEITLPVQIGGDGPTGRTIMETFKVVKHENEYNAILRRTTLYKLRAAVSIYHYSIKFATSDGPGIHYGDQRESRKCILAAPSLEIHATSETDGSPKLGQEDTHMDEDELDRDRG
ncbi:Unknown protein [Striga hermonthica]|uniref:Uncharacterized protein n=1 Tax=Striga hermonthica TaxID=68872 RepID=A0A9N7MH78_STRHE|nr:Unknown protein [Striga hermonthica]